VGHKEEPTQDGQANESNILDNVSFSFWPAGKNDLRISFFFFA
jgi:hypothetical protein